MFMLKAAIALFLLCEVMLDFMIVVLDYTLINTVFFISYESNRRHHTFSNIKHDFGGPAFV